MAVQLLEAVPPSSKGSVVIGGCLVVMRSPPADPEAKNAEGEQKSS